MTDSRPSRRGAGDHRAERGSVLALVVYLAVLLLLLLVFVAVAFVACSASVPLRVGYFPPR
jgi:hypothetical protein